MEGTMPRDPKQADPEKDPKVNSIRSILRRHDQIGRLWAKRREEQRAKRDLGGAGTDALNVGGPAATMESGKTILPIRAIADTKQSDGMAVLIDAELAIDRNCTERLGIKIHEPQPHDKYAGMPNHESAGWHPDDDRRG
jgi:hypothetical protein